MSLSRLFSILSFLMIFGIAAAPAAGQSNLPPVPDCSTPRPAAAPGELTSETLDFSGATRQYRLYVPASYDPTQPTALVMSFHGFASNAGQQALFSGWNALADEEGVIVVYPQGMGFPARWNGGELFVEGFAQADDVGFVRALIAHLSQTLCIDPTRIYANGLSNGAGMSNRLACDASDLIAGIGGVAGAYAPLMCAPDRPVPVIAFHGTDDRIVPIDGLANSPGGGALPAVRDWIDGWAFRNGCDMANPVDLEPVGAVTGIRYTNCLNNAEVVYYIAEGAGHTWPGGGSQPRFIVGEVNQDIDATRLMWEFFQQHPLRPAPGM